MFFNMHNLLVFFVLVLFVWFFSLPTVTMMATHADACSTFTNFTRAYAYVSSYPHYPRGVGTSVSQTDLRRQFSWTDRPVWTDKPVEYIYPQTDLISVSQITNACEV